MKAVLGVLNHRKQCTIALEYSDWLPDVELAGKKFLDIGSGSGLFSLAAKRLGADVFSFDYDMNSVECTRCMRDQHGYAEDGWFVERGDVLDDTYLQKLYGQYDIVYSWGVLHHTGNMWKALENAELCLNQQTDSMLFIAIYNDQGQLSNRWKKIKKTYCSANRFGKAIMRAFILFYEYVIHDGWRFIKHPIRFCKNRKKDVGRGMNRYHDIIDWYGGYPFEVAKPEEIFDFYKQKGYSLEKMSTCEDGSGCNQFVFKKR